MIPLSSQFDASDFNEIIIVEYPIEIWNVQIDDPLLGVFVLDCLEIYWGVEYMNVAHTHEDMLGYFLSNQLEDIRMRGGFFVFLNILLLVIYILKDFLISFSKEHQIIIYFVVIAFIKFIFIFLTTLTLAFVEQFHFSSSSSCCCYSSFKFLYLLTNFDTLDGVIIIFLSKLQHTLL